MRALVLAGEFGGKRRGTGDSRGRAESEHPVAKRAIDTDLQSQSDASVRQVIEPLRGMPFARSDIASGRTIEVDFHVLGRTRMHSQ